MTPFVPIGIMMLVNSNNILIIPYRSISESESESAPSAEEQSNGSRSND